MLIVRNISIQDYKNRQLIDDLSFTVNKGDKIAIIGEEGNGKSTLMKLIYDETLVKHYCETKGVIDKKGLRLGYLPQMLSDAWNDETVISFLLKTKPESEINIDQYNNLEKYYQLCSSMQLDSSLIDRDQIISTLSGGEKMKLQILKLLFEQPDILLFDEPTNDLDIHTLEWLEEFILSISNPVLFISHDETLLERVATGVIHIEQLEKKKVCKHTVVHMPYSDYVNQRLDLIERENSIARKEKSEQDKQLAKWRQIFQKVEYRQATVSRQDPHSGQLMKKKMKSVKAMKRRIDQVELTKKVEPEEAISLFFNDTPVLSANRIILDVSIPHLSNGDLVLANNIQLFLKGQDKIVIFGNNGCGKTTLLHELLKHLKKVDDVKIGYMPQRYEELLDNEISPIVFLAPSGNKDDITLARNHLGSAKFLPEEMEQPINQLSGGQKAKLILIHLILSKANVLVLDEPTRNLSPLSNPVIRQMLQDYQGAILSVSHDRKFIEEVPDTIYEFTKNGLVEWQKKINE